MNHGKSPARFAPYLLCLAIFAVYWKRILWDNMLPCDGGTLRVVYPSWVIVRNALSHFDSLLWDPLRNMGQPLLASPPTEALYPLQWLSPFIDFFSYSKIFIAVHTTLVLVYGFKLFEHFYRDRTASLLGAIALGFNGLMLDKASVHCDFAAMSWIPACLYYLARLQPRQLGICVALQWLAGLPTYSILTGVMMVMYALLSQNPRQHFRVLASGVALGLGLSALQWIPFLEFLQQSKRGVFLDKTMAMAFSLHPVELARGLALPSALGARLPIVSNSDPAVIGFFIGPVLLALFALGFWRLPKFEKSIGGLAAFAMALSLGQYTGVYQHIPFITIFRFPALWMVPATLGVIWVSIACFNRLHSPLMKQFLFGAVVLDLLAYSFTPRLGYADATFLTSTTLRPQSLQTIPAGTRLFHTWAITNTVHRWQIRTVEDWNVFKGMLVPSIGSAYGIAEVESNTQLASQRHLNFLIRLNQAPAGSPLFSEARISKIVTLTPAAATKGIPNKSDVRIIDNASWKPRAFMDTGQPVQVLQDKPGTIECLAQGPGKLVVSESFFPGWKAYSDGISIPVGTFDETFLSVDVAQGPHRILLRYRPTSFYAGLLISITTMILMLWWWRRPRFEAA